MTTLREPEPEPEPEQTDLSTQDLPLIPKAEDMESWDEEKVLLWIQKRNRSILRGNNLENFKKECIIGTTFLTSDVEFYQTCGLPRGIGRALEKLADQVKEDELSVKIAGWKRKTLLTSIPISVHPLPGVVDKLSDPALEHKLPFPFTGKVPVRFKMGNQAKQEWSYAGRTMFKKLVEELNMVRDGPTYSALWLYGTQGFGKSHLLAVLVCYLAAQNERVVYIPDCREWLGAPVGYFKDALLFAWADDPATQEEIGKLIRMREIETFFGRQKNVVIVGDQLNALTESNCPSEEQGDRADLYRWLIRFTFQHTAVFSSSANYKEFVDKSKKQTSYNTLYVYDGLDRMEMDQWWKRHINKIDMGGYQQSDVEDMTGSIPLLLDKCVVNGKIDLTVGDLRELCHRAVGFVHEIRKKTEGTGVEWDWYTECVKACISRQKVPSGWTEHLDLVDHRYFYQRDDDTGGYTCGLIRDAVGEQLLMWKVDFADTDFLTSLHMFTNNPSVTGFMIESAVLSSIRSQGLAIRAKIRRPMRMRLFADLFNITTDITGVPVLYCPKKFNNPAVDGVIVLIEPIEPVEEKHPKEYKWGAKKNTKNMKNTKNTRKNAKKNMKKNMKKDAEDNEEDEDGEEYEEDEEYEGYEEDKEDEEYEEDEGDEKDKDYKEEKKKEEKKKQKLRIFPLQITLALVGHKDSHAQFFDHYYDKWAKDLSDFDVVLQFLWITPDRRSVQKHKACDKWPEHVERFIHLEDVNRTIWRKYQQTIGDTG